MDDERRRRIEALGALGAGRDDAGGDVPPRRGPPARPRPARRAGGGRTRRRVVVARVGLLLAVAALAAGALWAWLGAPTRPPRRIAGPVTFARSAGLACISPPAWAPDGRTFAVLGTPTQCGSLFVRSNLAQADPAQELAIFAADTGQVVRAIPLAHLLPSVPSGTADCTRTAPGLLSLCYDQMLWSPDGRSIALRFAAPGSDAAVQNLLVVRADGSGAAIVPGHGYTPSRPDGQTFPPLAVWDLTTRTVRYAPVPAAFSTAARLTWGTAGTLTPSAGADASPIGNPSGDASFTPWQPGTLAPGETVEAPPRFTAAYGAWSPDGHYVATGLLTSVGLSGAATPAAVGVPTRAPRDAALAALPTEWQPDEVRRGEQVAVAWQPAGRYLVAVTCVTATTAQARVFATADNRLAAILTFAVPDANVSCAQQSITAAWSPDGRHIVLAAPAAGALRVWAPSLA